MKKVDPKALAAVAEANATATPIERSKALAEALATPETPTKPQPKAKKIKRKPVALSKVKGVGKSRRKALVAAEIKTADDLAKIDPAELAEKTFISLKVASDLVKNAQELTKTATKRSVKAFAIVPIDEQSRYERRHYMRDFHNNEKPEVVRHSTSHKLADAKEQILAFMKPEKKYRTGDIVEAIDSFGPSYGDVIRNSMRALKKEGKVQIDRISLNERTRAKYEYSLI